MIFLKGRKRDNNFAMSSLFKLQLFADRAYLIFSMQKVFTVKAPNESIIF